MSLEDHTGSHDERGSHHALMTRCQQAKLDFCPELNPDRATSRTKPSA